MRILATSLVLILTAIPALPMTANASESPIEFLMNRTNAPESKPKAVTPSKARTAQRFRAFQGGGSDGGAIAGMIRREAARQGVPPAFAVAIAKTESGLRCRAVGRHGELGPFQIKPATARGIGFRGAASALNSCGAGLVYGIRHLRLAYARCGTTTGAAALHNGGLGASCRSTAYTRLVARRY